jgi:enoyl-CoA hydratase
VREHPHDVDLGVRSSITGGMEMAPGCDFLVASDQAVLVDTHARVGILPRAGMTARLPTPSGLGWRAGSR